MGARVRHTGEKLTILAFLFVLGVLIFVHELGHFLLARRIGVRVLTFSLGFGPKLLTVKRGDTEYCISAIPLGGYVKMAGENPEDNRTGAPDEFLSKSKWQRFQVLVAGPIMNLVLAVVVMAVVFYQGAPVPLYEQQPAVIGTFVDGSAGAKAGLQAGDRIVSVNGEPVDTWEQLSNLILPRGKVSVTLGYVRDGRAAQLTAVPAAQGRYQLGDLGIQPTVHPQIVAVSSGLPAQEAGLKEGDVILGADGQLDISYEHLIAAIQSHDARPLRLTVKRAGLTRDVTVTPRPVGDKVMIGAQFTFLETVSLKPGAIGSVKLSVEKNWEWARQIFETLGGLITRNTSMKQLMGPVAIADLSGTAAQAGWLPLFTLMAMISVNLGLLNLMPVPVLDGGHILILALEGLARRDFSMKLKEKMLGAGFILLLLLMVTVIYNDLMRIPWILKLVQLAS
jgi:regulator of sigma E protease